MSDFDLEEHKKQRQKVQCIGKLIFWAIAIPVGATICILLCDNLHITGCAMGGRLWHL